MAAVTLSLEMQRKHSVNTHLDCTKFQTYCMYEPLLAHIPLHNAKKFCPQLGKAFNKSNENKRSCCTHKLKVQLKKHAMPYIHKLSLCLLLRRKAWYCILFFIGEEQGMLVNNECSSWYDRVGDFLVSIWDRRKQVLYTDRSACMAGKNNPTPPECVVNGTEYYDGWMWAISFFLYLLIWYCVACT